VVAVDIGGRVRVSALTGDCSRAYSRGVSIKAIDAKHYGKPAGKPVLKWGRIDKTGSMTIAPEYDYMASFSEGLARVVVNGKHGYVDAAGRTIVEPKFDCGWEFSRGLARVSLDRKEGYIGRTGQYVWEPK